MNKNDAGSASQSPEENFDALKGAMKGLKGLVDQGVQKVDAIKAKVSEAKDEAVARGSDMLERVSDVIKANPIKSVAVAFAAGYIGMRLFRRG